MTTQEEFETLRRAIDYIESANMTDETQGIAEMFDDLQYADFLHQADRNLYFCLVCINAAAHLQDDCAKPKEALDLLDMAIPILASILDSIDFTQTKFRTEFGGIKVTKGGVVDVYCRARMNRIIGLIQSRIDPDQGRREYEEVWQLFAFQLLTTDDDKDSYAKAIAWMDRHRSILQMH